MDHTCKIPNKHGFNTEKNASDKVFTSTLDFPDSGAQAQAGETMKN